METVKAVTDVAKSTRLIERPIHGLESNSLIRAVRGFSRTHSRIAAWRLVRLHMAVRSIARGRRPKRAADRLQAGSEPREASKSVLRASAEHQIKTGVPGLPVDLRRLRLSCTLPRICSAPPIRPCHAKGCLDHRQGQVLLVQEAGPFAGLCLVLPLHAKTRPRVQRSEPVLEPESRFFGIK